MTTTEEALELATRLERRGEMFDAADVDREAGELDRLSAQSIRALVAERDEAQAKLAQVRKWWLRPVGQHSLYDLAQPDDEAKEACE